MNAFLNLNAYCSNIQKIFWRNSLDRISGKLMSSGWLLQSNDYSVAPQSDVPLSSKTVFILESIQSPKGSGPFKGKLPVYNSKEVQSSNEIEKKGIRRSYRKLGVVSLKTKKSTEKTWIDSQRLTVGRRRLSNYRSTRSTRTSQERRTL